LPPTPEPVSALAGVTNRDVRLRVGPWVKNSGGAPVIRILPAGTPVTVVGRNINSRFFNVEVEGTQGWVYGAFMDIDGNFARLPIVSRRDGYGIRGFYPICWGPPEYGWLVQGETCNWRNPETWAVE